MLQSATEFRKNGFNDEDAAQLGQIASMYQNVSDEAISASDSASFIIAQMVAFGIEAENAEHIIDSVNEVANNFAVSSGQLANSLGIVSSTASAMGNNMEETLGMMTAITEQTKNSSKAARGLNSIFNNLAQVLDDASSNGKKITEIFNSLNISMYDNEGQLLSSYELLGKLSEKWDTLDNNTKNYIASTIAGTNQLNNFLALMNNFDHAIEATETAINSTGSAVQENTRYMEGLEAKTQAVKASFEELSNTVVDSELVKSVLDLANAFLKLANTPIGTYATQVGLLTGVLWGGTGLIKAMKVIPSFFANASTAVSGFAGALSLSAPQLLIVSAGIAGIITIIKGIKDAWDESNPSLEEAENRISDLNKQLESNRERLIEIESLPWNEKTSEILAEKDALELQNEELEKNIRLNQERKEKAAVKGANQTQEIYRGTKYRTFGQEITWDSIEEAVDSINEIYGEGSNWADFLISKLESFNVTVEASGDALNNSLIKIIESATNDLTNFGVVTENNNNILQNNIPIIQEQVEYYTTLKDLGYTLTDSQQKLVDIFNQYTNVSQDVINNTEEATKAFNDAYNGILLNQEQYEKLISVLPQIKDLLTQTTNGWKLDTEAVIDAAANGEQWAIQAITNQQNVTNATIQSIETRIKAYQAEMDAMMLAQGGRIGTTEATEQDIKAYMDLFKASTKLQGVLAKLKNTPLTTDNTSQEKTSIINNSSSSSSKQATDEALKNFQSYYKDLQHLRDMDKIDEETYLNQLRILIDNYIADATANMKKYGIDSKEITQNMYQYEEELFNGWKELQEEKIEIAKETQQQIIDNLENKKSVYEKLFSYMTDKIQDKINELQDSYDEVSDYWDNKINTVQKQNEELEEQITLEQKLNDLAKAEQSKSLVYKDGRFQYVQNIDEVSKAKEELESYQRDQALQEEVQRLEELKNQALDSIQEQIDSWEEYKEQWSSVVDKYEENQERLLIEQELGIELEGELWQNRLDNLQDYADEYESIIQQIIKANEKLNAISNIGSTSTSVGFEGTAESNKNYHFDYSKPKGEYGSVNEDPGVVGSDAWKESLKTSQKYANGTSFAKSGLSLVGENGPELRVLNSGDGIIPSDITKNLWSWGATTPASLISNIAKNFSSMGEQIGITIQNFSPNLPSVTDGENFVNYMKNNFWRETIQFAKR